MCSFIPKLSAIMQKKIDLNFYDKFALAHPRYYFGRFFVYILTSFKKWLILARFRHLFRAYRTRRRRRKGYLKILEKISNSIEIKIETSRRFVTIGRSPESDLQLQESIISWEHGNILFTDNRYIYRHVSKTNSTFIKRNKRKFLLCSNDKKELKLRNNDQIIIGDHTFIIQL